MLLRAEMTAEFGLPGQAAYARLARWRGAKVYISRRAVRGDDDPTDAATSLVRDIRDAAYEEGIPALKVDRLLDRLRGERINA